MKPASWCRIMLSACERGNVLYLHSHISRRAARCSGVSLTATTTTREHTYFVNTTLSPTPVVTVVYRIMTDVPLRRSVVMALVMQVRLGVHGARFIRCQWRQPRGAAHAHQKRPGVALDSTLNRSRNGAEDVLGQVRMAAHKRTHNILLATGEPAQRHNRATAQPPCVSLVATRTTVARSPGSPHGRLVLGSQLSRRLS